MDNISPSPSNHVRLSSADSDMHRSSSSYSSDAVNSTTSSLMSCQSEMAVDKSPFTSPPTTPRSPLLSSRLHHRFTSRDKLFSFDSSAQKGNWGSTSNDRHVVGGTCGSSPRLNGRASPDPKTHRGKPKSDREPLNEDVGYYIVTTPASMNTSASHYGIRNHCA